MHNTGRISHKEMDIIKDQISKKVSVEEIAKGLNRHVSTVKRWILEHLSLDASDSEEMRVAPEYAIIKELRTTPEWKNLNKEFLLEEVEYFEYKYSRMVAQFKGDVLPTEEAQIFLLIKIDILMARNLRDRQRAVVDIQRLEQAISNMYASGEANQAKHKDRLINLENQLASSQQAQTTKTTEFLKLADKHSNIMKELKATRDQRISRIENAKQSFTGLLKALQDEEMRAAEGRDMELMRVAGEKELHKLAQPHKYIDGTYDLPILSAETLEINDKGG